MHETPIACTPPAPIGCGDAVLMMRTFNNLPGTLTDGPRAFLCSFRVCISEGLKFEDLINYCLMRNQESLGSLPSRNNWGAVNPVLLMEDPVDPTTGKIMHKYTITSRGHLSAIVANPEQAQSLCYNEVFLPGKPVS